MSHDLQQPSSAKVKKTERLSGEELEVLDPCKNKFDFNVHLSVNEMGEVQLLRVEHYQDKKHKDGWNSWEPKNLIDFISSTAGVRAISREIEEQLDCVTQISDSEEAATPPRLEAVIGQDSLLAPTSLTGLMRLNKLEIMADNPNCLANIIYYQKPFSFRLSVDFIDVIAPDNVTLKVRVTVMAQDGKKHYLAGEAINIIRPSESSMLVKMAGNSLLPGIYLLEVKVTVTAEGYDFGSHQHILSATMKDKLLEVI
jgi:hypothetical protein